jgi:hypothetical protein
MRHSLQWIPIGGLLVTMAIAVAMLAQLHAQKAAAGDYSKAAVAEVHDAQGQVILRGSFVGVDDGDDDDVERKARLEAAGTDADAAGEAEIEVSTTNAAEQEIEFSIRNVQGSAAFVLIIDGREVARATSDGRGRVDVDLEVETATPPTR